MKRDPHVHFRYHDAVNALLGNHRYRYEPVRLSEVEDLVAYLTAKGYDEFSVRRLGSLDPWQPYQLVIPQEV